MRSIAPLFLLAVAIAVAIIVGAQLASAGSADAPELEDVAADCAVPYGNAYLDIVSAWIDTETAETFDVHLKLASWQAEIAEGSGYTVQFTHQGVQWGIVAVYSSVVFEGWQFLTGVASAELVEDLDEAPGAFDPESAEIVVTFPKSIFPHQDATDTTLRGFVAMSADLRPAYPFFLGEEAGLDGNGRWIVCDDAVGAGEFAFSSGQHSSAHSVHDASNATDDAQEPAIVAAASAEQDDTLTPQPERDTPFAPLPLVLLGLALAIALRRR